MTIDQTNQEYRPTNDHGHSSPRGANAGSVLVVTQHYLPDRSTTAAYVSAIAEALAQDRPVVVLSGTPNSGAIGGKSKPTVVKISNWMPDRRALLKRALAVVLFALQTFFSTLRYANRNSTVFCTTTPFTLPYAAMLAAKMRGSATAVLIYDFYPEAMEMAGLVGRHSMTSRLIRFANRLLLPKLDAIITIGRDVEALLLSYHGVSKQQIYFIPNWTLVPIEYRPADPLKTPELIVGLSGTLGFTHNALTVFEAAEIVQDNPNIYFMLSGWGVGWQQLQDRQAAAQLGNVSLSEPVPESELIAFLASADVWVIPYRRGVAGVSVPSRIYNLLAVGRAIIVAAELESEAAMIVREEDIGWVVSPEDPQQLAEAIRAAAADPAGTAAKGQRAAMAANKYTAERSLSKYRELFQQIGNRHCEAAK